MSKSQAFVGIFPTTVKGIESHDCVGPLVDICKIRALSVNRCLSAKASVVFQMLYVLLSGSTAELQGCNTVRLLLLRHPLRVLLPFAAVKRVVIRAKGLPFDLLPHSVSSVSVLLSLAVPLIFFFLYNRAAASQGI